MWILIIKNKYFLVSLFLDLTKFFTLQWWSCCLFLWMQPIPIVIIMTNHVKTILLIQSQFYCQITRIQQEYSEWVQVGLECVWDSHSSAGTLILEAEWKRRLWGHWGKIVDAPTSWHNLPTAIICGQRGAWPSIFHHWPEIQKETQNIKKMNRARKNMNRDQLGWSNNKISALV